MKLRRQLVAIMIAPLILSTCGEPARVNSATPKPSPVGASSPAFGSATADSVTARYVALVHDYWSHYVTARGNGAVVCGARGARAADPAMCRERAVAILAVHEKFLSDLDTTPPPPQFAADDQAFRLQLPKAITDVKAMIAAAEHNDPSAVLQATSAYVSDMIPIVTDALDHVDPAVVHD